MNRRRLLLCLLSLHQRSFWRNPESAFFNFALPLTVLLTYGATVDSSTMAEGHARVLTLFVPGIVAFAVVVVAYGNLAATIAAQRCDGVLKRLRSTPIEPSIYVVSQLLSVLLVTLLITGATIGLGVAVFGALPRADAVPQLLIVLTLGIGCFTALGMAISIAIPTADAAAPITNGTYLPLAMASGMFSATLHLPRVLETVISAFPLKPLTDALRDTYVPTARGIPVNSLAVLAAWTLAGVAISVRYFRWEP